MNSGWHDRVGLAWRDELAPQIYLHLDRIEHIEILAEREFRSPRRRIDALRELALMVPVSLHGVGMGLASSLDVDRARLDAMARLVQRIEPAHWSEHLAFVRAGGFEIGHLAAAPYAPETLEGTLRNLGCAGQVIGSFPHLENTATLLYPPGSIWSEAEFVSRVIRGASVPLLLDLHNLHANAWNFGRDPYRELASMPLDCVRTVHLSGGHVAESPQGLCRLIDDHTHDPPPVVYALLEELAAHAPHSLTVIIERDGAFPHFSAMLDQLERARRAVHAGRARYGPGSWPRAA